MKRVLLSLSLILALAVAAGAFAQQITEYAAFQGLKGRVADLANSADGRTLASAGKDKLPARVKKHDRPDDLLAKMMQQFHDEVYGHFIRQGGEGFGRIPTTVAVVKRAWRMPDWTSEELAKEPPVFKGASDLALIHRLSLRNFGNSNSMTIEERLNIDDRNPLPNKQQLWEIKSLDLVGLVMHETPIVYVSEKLLQMKDLKTQPTRALDLFESEGLEQLIGGKELYIRSQEETVRVLGPITAGKSCLKCHGDAKEGDMFGAFSYTLRPGQYLLNGHRVPSEDNGAPRPTQYPPAPSILLTK